MFAARKKIATLRCSFRKKQNKINERTTFVDSLFHWSQPVDTSFSINGIIYHRLLVYSAWWGFLCENHKNLSVFSFFLYKIVSRGFSSSRDRVISLSKPKHFSSTLGNESQHVEDQTDVSGSSFFSFFFAAKHFSRRSEAVSHDMMQVCWRPCLITGVCVCVVGSRRMEGVGVGGWQGIGRRSEHMGKLARCSAPQSGEHTHPPPPPPNIPSPDPPSHPPRLESVKWSHGTVMTRTAGRACRHCANCSAPLCRP